ncbi:MAG: formimidoylglutamate deiminase [Alphaproteobacteria bacterium]
MKTLLAERVLLADGWAHDVRIDIDEHGVISAIAADEGERNADWQIVQGAVVPGMANLHSHAFQRAIAGMSEHGTPERADSFWSWRDQMYAALARLGPDEMAAVAAQLYLEMLKRGYTCVGEFHYVHHDTDGRPYDDPALLSLQVVGAARRVGIAICHLPTLYCHGGFDRQPLAGGQLRFGNDVDGLLNIRERVIAATAEDNRVSVGIALHSLRAVPKDEMTAATAALGPDAPIHIHVAEQTSEVEGCVATLGARPVEYLLASGGVDGRWCLVHATHVSPAEMKQIVASGAVVGLCPTTEASLGDGLFPMAEFLGTGGRFGIGSDSHISVDPFEELRWLEYEQRLALRQRNVLVAAVQPSVGQHLYETAARAGGAVLGQQVGCIAVGYFADFVVLDTGGPALSHVGDEHLLDVAVFANHGNPVRDVYVSGRRVIEDGRHGQEEQIGAAYRRAIAHIREA